MTSKVNKTQIGGDHYKSTTGGEEHWDRVARLGLNYFQACATKYIERCYLKAKQPFYTIQDLNKAKHFIDKLIEIEEAKHQDEEASGAYVNQDPDVYKGDLRFKQFDGDYKDPYDK